MTNLATQYRTHTCGELRREHVAAADPGTKPTVVILAGTVDARRDSVSVLLRDRYGKTLVTTSATALPYVVDRLRRVKPEDRIQVTGEVWLRSEEEREPALPTGEILVRATKVEVYSSSDPVPAGILTEKKVRYEDRLAFRQ